MKKKKETFVDREHRNTVFVDWFHDEIVGLICGGEYPWE